MAIIDKNDISMGYGYYDENNVWLRKKFCLISCGDKCNCQPIDKSLYLEMPLIKYIDPYTFGNSQAAVTLAEILNEELNEKYREKVSCFISNHNLLIRHIEDIKDLRTRAIVGQMLIEKVNSSNMILPDKIKSFMKNVVIGNIKQKLIRDE